jgi:hypothetical protein
MDKKLRLPKKYSPIVLAYVRARINIARMAKSIRSLEKVVENTRSQIFAAMGASPIAMCGRYILTKEPGLTVEPSITLMDGRNIPLSEISSISLNDGTTVTIDNIAKLYSGRHEKDKLLVTENIL